MADAPEDAQEWTAPYNQPDYYDGAATQPLMDWIFRMELFLRAAGIAEDSTGAVHTAATYLKDEAVTWWRHLSERVESGWEPAVLTWAAFTTALTARFRVMDDGRNARFQLYYLCQTGSVQAYTQEFERLLLETPETHELDRVFNYTMGLEWNVRAEVERGHPPTWLQAIQLADRADLATKQVASIGPRRLAPDILKTCQEDTSAPAPRKEPPTRHMWLSSRPQSQVEARKATQESKAKLEAGVPLVHVYGLETRLFAMQ